MPLAEPGVERPAPASGIPEEERSACRGWARGGASGGRRCASLKRAGEWRPMPASPPHPGQKQLVRVTMRADTSARCLKVSASAPSAHCWYWAALECCWGARPKRTVKLLGFQMRVPAVRDGMPPSAPRMPLHVPSCSCLARAQVELRVMSQDWRIAMLFVSRSSPWTSFSRSRRGRVSTVQPPPGIAYRR
jgi:hypothetical protein